MKGQTEGRRWKLAWALPAALILHEPVGPMFLLAVALVVSGLVLVNRRR